MDKKILVGLVLATLLAGMLASVFSIHAVRASEAVYIRADGSINPPTAPISTLDNVTYILTGNITSVAMGIVVERDNIVVDGSGFTVEGTGENSSYGIFLDGRSNVTIQNTNITNFDIGIRVVASSNNSISGNNIANNGGGMYLDSSYNSIDENNITANSDFGIMLDSYSNYNSVSGNTFTDNGLAASWNSYSNSVENNTVNGRPLVYLEGVADFSVGDAGQVVLVRCDRMRVENLNLSRTSISVQLWATNNSIVSGNTITNNGADGIVLGSSSDNSISGNTITNNYCGIRLDSSSNSSISGNIITNNSIGIMLDSYSNNSINGNIIANNTHGIWLSNSFNNSISGNSITNNDNGIYLDYASNNSICHNNFVNNTQAYSLNSTNVWDDGYPSGGNYWSDYNGTDADHDGIGDTPYVIDADNTDHYPLMVQYVIPEFPSFLILPLFFITTLLAAIVYRKKGVSIKQTRTF